MAFKVETIWEGEECEQFRMIGPGGEESEPVDFDCAAVLVIDDDIFLCRIEDENAETATIECVTQTRRVETVKIEEVTFSEGGREVVEVEGDDDDDDGGDDPDGGEELEAGKAA